MICMNLLIKSFMVLPRLKRVYMPRRGNNVNDGVISANFLVRWLSYAVLHHIKTNLS